MAGIYAALDGLNNMMGTPRTVQQDTFQVPGNAPSTMAGPQPEEGALGQARYNWSSSRDTSRPAEQEGTPGATSNPWSPPVGSLGSRLKAWATAPGQGGSQYGNGDGGEEANGEASDAHDELNTKMDALSEKVGGMQGGAQQPGGAMPGAQNRNAAFSGSGIQQAAAPRPDVLEHTKQVAALARQSMADSHAALQAGQDRTMALFQQRQSKGSGVSSTGSALGMSAGYSEASMGGALTGTPMRPASGIGQSAGTFQNTKWRNQ